MTSPQHTARVFETPNARMHTYASRQLTDTDLAMWRVEMAPGAAAPAHAADREQVIVVIEGVLTVETDRPTRLAAGEAVALAPGVLRQLRNESSAPASAMVASPSGATATVPGQEPVPIPWAQ